MSSYIQFQGAFPDTYYKCTQFIFDYRMKRIQVIDPESVNTFTQYNIGALMAENMSKSYNKFKVSSFVISTTKSSYIENENDFLEVCLSGLGYNMSDEVKNNIIFRYDAEYLGIIEKNNSKGWHLHLLVFHKNSYTSKKEFEVAQVNIHTALNDAFKEHNYDEKIIINCQTAKSVGSLLHYLKKDPHYVITDNINIMQMFIGFHRFHIFPKDSEPKYTNVSNHTLPLSTIITFFNRKLNEGCIDFEGILQDPYSVNLLGNNNLQTLFETTRTHYLANRKFEHAIGEIMKKFILKDRWYKKCICPIVEYLKLQNIDINTFENKFVFWLKCNSKKNTLALIGPPDTGKSVFFSTLHSNFRFANRLTTDGIFTFSNAIHADIIYHEEPFIGPETCEVAKLVYEGNPDTTVAVKNKKAVRLNKKIPCLVTANKVIWQYCSGSRDAFNARMFSWSPNYKLSEITFCDDVVQNFDDEIHKIHQCFPLNADIKRRADKEFYGAESDTYQRRWSNDTNIGEENQSQGNVIVDCGLIHKLRKCHWRAYIFYLILKFNIKAYYKYIETNLEEEEGYCTVHHPRILYKDTNFSCKSLVLNYE